MATPARRRWQLMKKPRSLSPAGQPLTDMPEPKYEYLGSFNSVSLATARIIQLEKYTDKGQPLTGLPLSALIETTFPEDDEAIIAYMFKNSTSHYSIIPEESGKTYTPRPVPADAAT